MSDRYAAITAHRTRFPVRLMCAALEVSVGGYYDSVRRAGEPPRGRRAADERLLVDVRAAHRASTERYGALRRATARRACTRSSGRRARGWRRSASRA